MKQRILLLLALAALGRAAAAEPGVTLDHIRLGQAAVFSGPAAQLGIQMRNGIKAYLDAVNERGGVHGRKIELVTEDNRYESAVAPSATVSGGLISARSCSCHQRHASISPASGLLWIRRLPRCSNLKCLTAFVT